MNKTIQDLRKIQIEGILKIKKLGTQTGTTEASFTNRIQEMEKRISGAEDTIEEKGYIG